MSHAHAHAPRQKREQMQRIAQHREPLPHQRHAGGVIPIPQGELSIAKQRPMLHCAVREILPHHRRDVGPF